MNVVFVRTNKGQRLGFSSVEFFAVVTVRIPNKQEEH